MKIKDELIKEAIDAIRTIIAKPNGSYDKVYNGYISSFGAAIIQSGLLPAIIFYESTQGEGDKSKVVEAIKLILRRINPSVYGNVNKMSDFIIQNRNMKQTISTDIHTAAIALKLGLRVFTKD